MTYPCPDCYVLEEHDMCLACERRDSVDRRWALEAKACKVCGVYVLWRHESGRRICLDSEGRHHACDPQQGDLVTDATQDTLAMLPWAEIKRRFDAPIDQTHYQDKPSGGGGSITYVPWFHIQGYLEWATNGHYDWEITNPLVAGQHMNVLGRLTIRCSDRVLVRMSGGAEKLTHKYGEPITCAEQQAFRRCCARFGFCIHLWAKGGK